MRNRVRIIRNALQCLLITLGLLLASCASQPIQEATDGRGKLLQAVFLYNQKVHALEGEGIGMYRSQSDNLSFRARINAYWPESNIRLDVQDFVFKKPLITLVRQGGKLHAAIHPRRTYFVMDYQNADLAELTGFDFPRRLIIPTLMGKVYLEDDSVAGVEGDRLVFRGKSVETVLTLNRELLPRAVEYRFQDEHIEVSFGKYTTEQGATFPRKIRVESAKGEKKLEITYSDVLLNQTRRQVSLEPEEWKEYDRVR